MDAALRSLLDWYAQMGVDVPKVPEPRPVKARRAAKPAAKSGASAKADPTAAATPTQTATDLSKVRSLDALQAAMNNFRRRPPDR